MKRIQTTLFFCAMMLFCFIPFSLARVCTIWGVAGKQVKDKRSLIAKNRDNLSYLYTVMKAVFPEKGFPFFGLFDIEADGYVTAGINKQGFVVVNTAANSVPRKKRHVVTKGPTQRLLTSFGSLNTVLSGKDLFQKSHPAIYIIGDTSKIASIEVAPAGKASIYRAG